MVERELLAEACRACAQWFATWRRLTGDRTTATRCQVFLEVAAGHPEGVLQSALVASLGLRPQAISRTLQELTGELRSPAEGEALVASQVAPQDRRGRVLRLTRRGEEVLEALQASMLAEVEALRRLARDGALGQGGRAGGK